MKYGSAKLKIIRESGYGYCTLEKEFNKLMKNKTVVIDYVHTTKNDNIRELVMFIIYRKVVK